MRSSLRAGMLFVALIGTASADTPPNFDAAAAFGARPSIFDLKLSPDGKSVAYVSAGPGQGAIVYTRALTGDTKPRVVMTAAGKPDRIRGCHWISSERLVCSIYIIVRDPQSLMLTYVERPVAVDANGGNPKILSKRTSPYTAGVDWDGGAIIDWLPDQDGSVLISRVTLPDLHLGSKIGSTDVGLGVDQLDTRNLAAKQLEIPNRKAEQYISDGRGNIRILEITDTNEGYYERSTISYLYRLKGSREWTPLSKYDYLHHEGFRPVAVDPTLDVAYGFKKKDGRIALYTVALDGSMKETLVYARDDVDIDETARIGRRQRVVGVHYSTDYPHIHYTDPAIEALTASISRALPTHPALEVIDSSVDENKLLIFAGSDTDAGVYYIFDRTTHELATFLVARDPLEGVKLATVKPVTYPATDGTQIPAYLTLPPGVTSPKGLPAVVMPHGGPDARDEWGFDWLAQFYAARGYAVLQPNYRGSAGYGDAWWHSNAFRSWPLAMSDVLDGGRWLGKEGIADPAKVAVVGWSYGGYAALQSAIVDSSVFKAVVAIAPVTDLVALREEHRRFTDYYQLGDILGTGQIAKDGSPAQNASKLKVPVLLFHGTDDINVNYTQSQLMDKSLTAAGVKHEFVTFPGLDHQLDDSTARAEMLRKSDAFLHQALNF